MYPEEAPAVMTSQLMCIVKHGRQGLPLAASIGFFDVLPVSNYPPFSVSVSIKRDIATCTLGHINCI